MLARTIQDVIDIMLAAVPDAPYADTVDVFKCGDPQQQVTGIVTTFTATIDVLRKAVELGANLVITHEPTFYEHREQVDWLADDPVYQAKRAFIEQHKLTIWRFHDYWHRHQPDGIVTGMARALGWEKYQQSEPHPALMVMPEMTVAALAAILKDKLALTTIRMVGDPQQLCQRVALLVGAWGGDTQIKLFQKWHADVVICGETCEWQTCEYVRDANALGLSRALIIVGHAKSEEEGMHYLVEWLQPRVAEIPITYLAVGEPIAVF